MRTPAPIRLGRPQGSYPWPWSVTPWFEGQTADRSLPDCAQGVVLAGFFEALHTAPPADAPHNPYRGIPLVQREETFLRCTQVLAGRKHVLDERLLRLWNAAIEAPVDVAPTWIHGDLHPLNVLVANGRICGVIDWGDMAQGDRATDLAATWMLLPQRDSRARVMAACRSVSTDTWRRARGWALLQSVVVLEAGDPALAAVAERTMRRLLEDISD